MRRDQQALARRDAAHHPRAIIMQGGKPGAKRGKVGCKDAGLIRDQAGKPLGNTARGLSPKHRVHPDMRVGCVRVVRIGAELCARQAFGHQHHRLAIGGSAGQHIAHAAFQPMAIGKQDIGGQQAGDIGARRAEQMRVHAFIDQGFRPDAVAANVAQQIAHHANGRQRTWQRAGLPEGRQWGQRQQPKAKAAACND